MTEKEIAERFAKEYPDVAGRLMAILLKRHNIGIITAFEIVGELAMELCGKDN